mmetsp:Transcript_4307/g.12894  ORF Transcript_4307/g.12894 Transcript_4307/m.12894 type:complete len:210 (+) Transcript_4307:160-789(+)
MPIIATPAVSVTATRKTSGGTDQDASEHHVPMGGCCTISPSSQRICLLGALRRSALTCGAERSGHSRKQAFPLGSPVSLVYIAHWPSRSDHSRDPTNLLWFSHWLRAQDLGARQRRSCLPVSFITSLSCGARQRQSSMPRPSRTHPPGLAILAFSGQLEHVNGRPSPPAVSVRYVEALQAQSFQDTEPYTRESDPTGQGSQGSLPISAL